MVVCWWGERGSGSFAVVDAFDAGGYPGEDFVGDGAEGAGYGGYGLGFAEYFHAVASDGVGAGYVDHADVHADVSYCGTFYSVDNHRGVATAKVAVKAVGIAYGECGYDGVAGDFSTSAITYGFA